jgi:tetratricopeptide (TPR) repeat protein
MKTIQKTIVGVMVLGLLFLFGGSAQAALKKGEAAKNFSALDAMKKKPMVILYFFKLGAKPSQAGLDHLKWLHGEYEKAGVGVIAIASVAQGELGDYLAKNPLPFSVVGDDGTVFRQHEVQAILPTTYILGPGGRVADVVEGGGASSHTMITAIAHRTLQLKKTPLAQTLFASVAKADPKNTEARAGLARVHLAEGKIDRAEEAVSAIAKENARQAKELLIEVSFKKGAHDQAIRLAEELQQEAPESGLVHLVRGNVLAIQGKNDEALTEFARGEKGSGGGFSQEQFRTEAATNAGRIHSDKGRYPDAQKMYEIAMASDPFSSETLSDLGVMHEKQGNAKQATAFYRDALTANPADEVAKALMERITQHLAFQEDMERKKRVDTLVGDLVNRYKTGGFATAPASDPWTPRPMTVAFLELKSTGGALMREGTSQLLQDAIVQNLMEGGRVFPVEREMLDQLLAELKLGSSELADPDTALKLGRLLSARLMTAGSLTKTAQGLRLSLRLINPETSAVEIAHSDELSAQDNFSAFASRVAGTLDQKIRSQYPLKGRIALVEGDGRVVIDLGARHGVKPGTELLIIEEGEPIVSGGRTIGHQKKTLGRLKVVAVEENLSYGQPIDAKEPIQKSQKVMEQVARQ